MGVPVFGLCVVGIPGGRSLYYVRIVSSPALSVLLVS